MLILEHQKHKERIYLLVGNNFSPRKYFQWQVGTVYLWITILKVHKRSIRRKSIVKELFHLFDNLSTQFVDSSHSVYSTRWGWFVHMENIYYWIKVLILFLAFSASFPNWTDQWYYLKKHVEEQTPEIRKSVFKHEL